MNSRHATTALILLVMLISWGCVAQTASVTPSATAAPSATAVLAAAPQIGGCPVFPANNIWNTPVDTLPVDPNSDAYVNSIGSDTEFHPDFGSDPTYGIPYVVVPQGQPKVPITFEYDDESDPGPYPIPPNPPIEGGPDSDGDRHILVVEQGTCMLYETWSTYPNDDGSWSAGSGAIFDLRSNALRPDTWTSADAAGLPVLPGLVRRDEVLAGEINHALRFTARETRRAYIWPARHFASDNTDPNLPPMGQHFRLKASFDISQYPQYDQVILKALKKYGMILADNGSDWYISGATDPNWDDDALNLLKQLQGSDFEAVDVSSLQLDPNSAQVRTMSQKTVAPAAARQGQQVAYHIQIGGDGTPVALTDPLPAGVTMVSNSLTTTPDSAPKATFTGGAVAWNGQPDPGETVDIRYSVTLSTATTQVIRNTATISRGGSEQELTATVIANPRQNYLPLSRR